MFGLELFVERVAVCILVHDTCYAMRAENFYCIAALAYAAQIDSSDGLAERLHQVGHLVFCVCVVL